MGLTNLADKLTLAYWDVLNKTIESICKEFQELVEHKENVTRYEFYYEPYTCKRYGLEYKGNPVAEWKVKWCEGHIYSYEVHFYMTRAELQDLIATT